MDPVETATQEIWPGLPLDAWKDSYATLHLWTQIVGKIRMSMSPWTNHSWSVTLSVTSRGLTTSPIPFRSRTFQIDFDFIDHWLLIETDVGDVVRISLEPQTVASFYGRVRKEMKRLGLPVAICRMPNEIPDPVRFDLDTIHRSYDPASVNRFWRVLVQADRVFKQFRARFIGKCSPVQFFWGSFDLAVTRFSGRKAPEHPGGIPNLPDWVAKEAYSHEVSSCGFWPGGGVIPYPAFYSYAYTEPQGFRSRSVRPEQAFYSNDLREFILPYDAVRQARNPDEVLLAFLQDAYEAAAAAGTWDREALERKVEPRRCAA